MSTDISNPQALQWVPALVLGDARTDATHEEFVQCLNAVASADASQQLAALEALLQHTTEHFAQEERWMLGLGLTAAHCHFSEHASVLDVVREVYRRAQAGQTEFVPNMVEALAQWFPQHALQMDGGLVQLMQTAGYDSQTETLTRPVDIQGPASQAQGPACDHGTSCGHG